MSKDHPSRSILRRSRREDDLLIAFGRRSGRGPWSVRAAVFGSVLVAVIVVEPCAGQQNVNAPGGVAVGGSLLNSPLEIKGVPAETLPGIIASATKGWRDLSTQQKETIDTLQKKLGVNENALKAFFAVLGEKEVPSEPALNKAGSDCRQLQGDVGACGAKPE